MASLIRSALLFLLFKTFYALNISVALTAPLNSLVVAPSLLSFSIEQDRWTDWVGSGSGNEFFYNTLQNLGRLSGEPPRIRIGANSEDRTVYNASVKFSEAIFPPPSQRIPYPEATNISVGNAFFVTAQFLPSKTRVIWGLNFGQLNLTTTFLEAKALIDAFSLPNITDSGIVLDAIELGNEADLYANNGMRLQGYNEVTYVKEWLSFATNISTALNLSSKSFPRFWAASFAGSSVSTTGFSPQAIINQGILNNSIGPLITTVSQHRYSGSFCTGRQGLLQDLMSKDSIRGNLSVFAGDIRVVKSKGLDYVLGETNSYACHGSPDVSNTAGAALWMLDYIFFASQIGISRVYLHHGIGFKYNLIQPAVLFRSPIDGTNQSTPTPPHIQPAYYAAIIAAEALFSGQANSATRVVELAIDHPRIGGYAFYTMAEGAISRVSKLLLVNLQAYFKGQGDVSTVRGRVHIDLLFSTNTSTVVPRNMTIKRLAIPYADDTSGLTWGGQTYETSNGLVGGEMKVERSAVEGGLDLWDTEAILVYLD